MSDKKKAASTAPKKATTAHKPAAQKHEPVEQSKAAAQETVAAPAKEPATPVPAQTAPVLTTGGQGVHPTPAGEEQKEGGPAFDKAQPKAPLRTLKPEEHGNES